MKRLVTIIIVCLAIAGCGSKPDASVKSITDITSAASAVPSPVASSMPDKQPSSTPKVGLEAVQEKLSEHWDDLQKEHEIAIQMWSVQEESIMMEIRSFGDAERVLSEEDIAAFKEALFELAGEKFPLELSVRECCAGEPFVTGKITEVDTETNRILVINEREKNGNTDDPVAYWVGLTKDGKVHSEGREASASFDQSLLGSEVKIWITGMVDQSYPAQVAAMKVVAE